MTEVPSVDDFLQDARKLHFASSRLQSKNILPAEHLDFLCARLQRAYNYCSHKLDAQAYKNFLDASRKAIDAFRDQLPLILFEKPRAALLLETKTLDLTSAYREFVSPFRYVSFHDREDMYPGNYLDFDTPSPRFTEPEPRFYEDEPADPDSKLRWRNHRRSFQEHELADWKQSKRDFEDTEVPQWKEEKRRYEAKQKEVKSGVSDLERVFIGTPFYRDWFLFHHHHFYQVPFSLDPSVRVAHQFVVSPSRSGKTTFLISQILEDLERVHRGECSIIAMDSENELIPELAKLAVFGPGGALEGKLIYLEPTKYPLSLNIFDRADASTLSKDDRDELYRSALTTTQFFINSIGKTETTGHQDIVLKFAIQALMSLPTATVADLHDLLKEKGFADYKDKFIDLDPDVARVMEFDIHTDMKPSTGAVRSRVNGIISDPLFRKVFSQQENKLDFFDLLQTPKVVLISTAGLDDATGPFGRFIIAKLYEAVLKRKFVPKSSKLPIYCYIDEASHYVPDEPMFAKMIDRVAKQGLGLIIATQREAHITNANVLDALKSVAIQVQTRKPNAIISIDKADPVTVHVPLIYLSKLPQMTVEQQAAIRSDMAKRFGPNKEPTALPSPSTPPEQLTYSPGEETDAAPWPLKDS